MYSSITAKIAFAGRFAGVALSPYGKWLQRSRSRLKRRVIHAEYLGLSVYDDPFSEDPLTLPPFRER
jgi:hypothetical protein